MSGGGFEVVWKLSNMSLEGITIASGFWKVSGRYEECIRKLFGKYLDFVWNKNPYLISTGRKGLICLEGVWMCLNVLREVYGRCFEGVWKVCGG